MTEKQLENIINEWYMEYNPYTDLFQTYCTKALQVSKTYLIEKKEDNFRAIFETKNNIPLMFEIKNAYDIFGVDLDSLSKIDIIKTIVPFIHKYA